MSFNLLEFELPYPPTWFIWLTGISLLLGHVLATALYSLNFPPAFPPLIRRLFTRKGGYTELSQDHIELHEMQEMMPRTEQASSKTRQMQSPTTAEPTERMRPHRSGQQ